ncbi:hypothetical protein [Flavobacterium sp. HSC-61S13]|uniref:hypothetical protein n=1 Tax=Flavobacterium sp. HSC-61S13 TaxID=2910963 RepID=UPI0020A18E16|nr:hypothetical protein [Flavobacterium sp. HSC-61S13]MCP1996746.1 hypothetical protein [Flavobacterium sp. HSC-61S13]
MKNVFIAFLLLCCCNLNAQIGINEREPKVSLHINKQTSDDQAVGVLFPRLPADQLSTRLAGELDGVLVYVTEPASNLTGALREVVQRGYYYYDANSNIWSLLGRRNTNIIEEDGLIYAKISRNGRYALKYPSNNNNTNFVDNFLTWHAIQGTPKSNLISIDADQTTIRFPKGHLFKITAMISIVSANKPGYVVTRFESQSSKPLEVSSWGYLETNNEAYQDGGVAHATTVIDTHSQEMAIRLNAPVYGHRSGNRFLEIAGNENEDPYYYTHLIIEEL